MTFLSRQRWVAEVQIQPIRNLGAKREWVVNATPWPLYPPAKPRYAFYLRLGRPSWMRTISPPPGFDPRTVKSVASRYTDYAIPAATDLDINKIKFKRNNLFAVKVLF